MSPAGIAGSQIGVGSTLLTLLYWLRKHALEDRREAADASAKSMHAHIMQYIGHELRYVGDARVLRACLRFVASRDVGALLAPQTGTRCTWPSPQLTVSSR